MHLKRGLHGRRQRLRLKKVWSGEFGVEVVVKFKGENRENRNRFN